MLTAALERLDALRRDGRQLRVGLIGFGAVGRTALTQLDQIAGIQVVAICDVAPSTAQESVSRADIAHPGLITDEIDVLFGARPDVVVEATGVPLSGVAHAATAIEHGCHVVMANAAADALAGPELARRAREAGVVYTLAQGDRPAIICDMVAWARANDFIVVAAGRGTVHRPGHHQRTPDTVWDLFTHTEEEIRARGYSARSFTAAVDGTQCAMEMASVANACGLVPQTDGLANPACGADRLAEVLVPSSYGGVLERAGTVEAVSTITPDGMPVPGSLRFGAYLTLSAPNDAVARTFRDHDLVTDLPGRFASVVRPIPLLGIGVPVSVLSAGLLGQSTGVPRGFVAEVVAVAKRDLANGETLDGIGGFTVRGRLMPARDALARRVLPIGLAHGCRLRRALPAGSVITGDDVDGYAPSAGTIAHRPWLAGPSAGRERIVVSTGEVAVVGPNRSAGTDPDDGPPSRPAPDGVGRRPAARDPHLAGGVADRVALSEPSQGPGRRAGNGVSAVPAEDARAVRALWGDVDRDRKERIRAELGSTEDVDDGGVTGEIPVITSPEALWSGSRRDIDDLAGEISVTVSPGALRSGVAADRPAGDANDVHVPGPPEDAVSDDLAWLIDVTSRDEDASTMRGI